MAWTESTRPQPCNGKNDPHFLCCGGDTRKAANTEHLYQDPTLDEVHEMKGGEAWVRVEPAQAKAERTTPQSEHAEHARAHAPLERVRSAGPLCLLTANL